MKKALKWLAGIVIVIICFIAGGYLYVTKAMPNVGDAPDLTIEATPERLERGKYLANSVTVCMDCHSTRDWSLYAGPLKEGTLGVGGEKFDRTMGFPGEYYSKNITPYGIGNWTDGELYRAITAGVDKDGEPLFPVMPYHYYGRMADEDIYSIIAYIRSLPSIESQVPDRVVDAPFNIIMRMIPKKGTPAASIPNPANTLEHGKYLTNASGCAECHTPVKDGQIIPDSMFAGGRVFDMPFGALTTPNITPHATGLGAWSKELFVNRFKQYQDSNYHSPKLAMTDPNTIMPWMMYSTMKDSDLEAIYEYLKTVTPIENTVVKFAKK